MKMPRKKYIFEGLMLYAFEQGIEAGRKLPPENCEEAIKDAKNKFCQELKFTYYGKTHNVPKFGMEAVYDKEDTDK